MRPVGKGLTHIENEIHMQATWRSRRVSLESASTIEDIILDIAFEPWPVESCSAIQNTECCGCDRRLF
jgi:hypothetical protein